MSEKTIENTDVPNIKDTKLTPQEHIEFLKKKLEEAERKATDSNIALIEMTAARNALYKSLQDTQLRLAETMSQRENDVEAYQKELELRLQEKRELQEKYDSLIIKAKRYDDLQESVVKIKMNAEVKAHTVIDEAQEKALDTVTLIDDIAKEINLFRDDITFLRRDIKIGTFTIDDRLENIYQRLCKNMNRLMKIKEDFYIQNSLPFDETDNLIFEGNAPVINYPENLDTDDIKKD